jgi:hypothetical protein
MAKELGLGPRSLIKNIPSADQRWKAPVEDWVRDLHARRFGERPPGRDSTPIEPLAPPEPATPPVNELEAARDALMARADELDEDAYAIAMNELERDTPVSSGEINDGHRHLLRRRDAFRRFAELFAPIAARRDFVQRIVLFGSVAAPLQKEIPRFSRLRRERIAVWHECKDVDLAIWVTNFTRLRELKRAVTETVNQWQEIANREHYGGIPHHQVDVFLLEPGTNQYRGNLCTFSTCPKGKPECEVAGCGEHLFLRLYEDFRFDPGAPFGPHAVVLFDRD